MDIVKRFSKIILILFISSFSIANLSEAGLETSMDVAIVVVESLLPSEGIEIDDEDGDDNTKAFVVAKADSGEITVTATPNPNLAEADLPSEWELTGGTGTGDLTRTVDKTTPGETLITCICGSSYKKAMIIVVEVEVTPASDAMDGANSGQFTVKVTPSDLNVSSYEWIFAYPEEAGNNPAVNFATGDGESTIITQAHWFAFPDSRLAAETGRYCIYRINCNVTINGIIFNDVIPQHPTWKVYLPVIMGKTIRPRIEGAPTIDSREVDEETEWYVKDIGTLMRTSPEKIIHIPSTSQFYNKADVHESRHVTQWTSMAPWQDLFDANSLYNDVLSTLSSPFSEIHLIEEVQFFIDYITERDETTSEETEYAREYDANEAANAVAPDYLEVDMPAP